MEQRLKNYLKIAEDMTKESYTKEELEILLRDMLTNIEFFQHERLIHLIVTLFFAVFTLISFVAGAVINDIMFLIMALTFMVLLVPYIRHYFILENGTQKLYTYYDELTKKAIRN